MNEFHNNNFYGKLCGKSIRDYYELDYTIQRSDNRVKYVKDMLGTYEINGKEFYDEFFEELFDTEERQKIKIHLSKEDSLYSTSNVAIYLERLGTYILNSKEHIIDGEVQQKKELKYKIYNSKELFRRACKEEKVMNQLAIGNGGVPYINNKETYNGEAFPIFQAVEQNYNKVKDVVFEKKDIEKHEVLRNYYDLYVHLINKMKSGNGTMELSYLVHGVKDDLNNGKLLLERPITFKSPLVPTGSQMFKEIDIPTEKEIRSLLRMKYEGIDDTDMVCVMMDFEDVLSRCTFTKNQQNVLNLYRRNVKPYQTIEILHMKQQLVNITINSICKVIEKKYWEEYRERYYTYVVKGTWKKCSKCGETKLIHHFSKNKDRYRPKCKKCETEERHKKHSAKQHC